MYEKMRISEDFFSICCRMPISLRVVGGMLVALRRLLQLRFFVRRAAPVLVLSRGV